MKTAQLARRRARSARIASALSLCIKTGREMTVAVFQLTPFLAWLLERSRQRRWRIRRALQT
jgi:hypothetical protein